MNLVISGTAPNAQTFVEFRQACGWGLISTDEADIAIQNSLLWASAKVDDQIVGFVRLIGDGALNFYVQDLIVTEAYRGQGLGRSLMEKLLLLCDDVVPTGATIGLMSVAGKETFYEAFGFQTRPVEQFGSGMTMTWPK